MTWSEVAVFLILYRSYVQHRQFSISGPLTKKITAPSPLNKLSIKWGWFVDRCFSNLEYNLLRVWRHVREMHFAGQRTLSLTQLKRVCLKTDKQVKKQRLKFIGQKFISSFCFSRSPELHLCFCLPNCLIMRRSDFGVVTSLFEESSDRPIAPQKGNECERSVKERKETIWLKTSTFFSRLCKVWFLKSAKLKVRQKSLIINCAVFTQIQRIVVSWLAFVVNNKRERN